MVYIQGVGRESSLSSSMRNIINKRPEPPPANASSGANGGNQAKTEATAAANSTGSASAPKAMKHLNICVFLAPKAPTR